MSLCVSDWLHLRCGMQVREKDGRHEGRVEAIHYGAYVTVRWNDTGWLTVQMSLDELEQVRRES